MRLFLHCLFFLGFTGLLISCGKNESIATTEKTTEIRSTMSSQRSALQSDSVTPQVRKILANSLKTFNQKTNAQIPLRLSNVKMDFDIVGVTATVGPLVGPAGNWRVYLQTTVRWAYFPYLWIVSVTAYNTHNSSYVHFSCYSNGHCEP